VTPPKGQRNPWIALLLSVFPGVGQLYNGQPSKAFFFFFAWVGCIWGAADVAGLPFGLLIPFVWFYNLVDAYRSACYANQQATGIDTSEDLAMESPAWGVGLVVLGLVLLFSNLGWLHLAALRAYWPVLLIVIGGVFLYGSIQRKKNQQPSPVGIDDDRLT
jgi:TM2 domain-containing membrane protein YozV